MITMWIVKKKVYSNYIMMMYLNDGGNYCIYNVLRKLMCRSMDGLIIQCHSLPSHLDTGLLCVDHFPVS